MCGCDLSDASMLRHRVAIFHAASGTRGDYRETGISAISFLYLPWIQPSSYPGSFSRAGSR